MYVDVAGSFPQVMDDTLLTYRLPAGVRGEEVVGCRVAIPFGRGNHALPGFVVRAHDCPPPEVTIKPLLGFLDDRPVLDQSLIDLGMWIAKTTVCSPYAALKAMVPGSQTEKIGFRLHILSTHGLGPVPSSQEEVWKQIKDKDCVTLGLKAPSSAHLVLADLGFLRIEAYFIQPNAARKRVYYRALIKEREDLDQATLVRAPRQREILLDLWANGPQSRQEVQAKHGPSSSPLQGLLQKGLVERFEEDALPVLNNIRDFIQAPARDLSQDQRRAVNQLKDKINARSYSESLLYGVTGSGKTEVYIHAIEETLRQNQEALLLVPEIALTVQLLGRLQGAIDSNLVGVWHSGLSPQERIDIWEAIRKGQIKVLVGARSAVFSPFPNLGLILIDEAHESSYKQGEPEPRYHAVKVARKRAQMLGCPLVLGSATPSLDHMQAVFSGQADLLRLSERVGNRPMPSINLIDMRQYPGTSLFSPDLITALDAAFTQGDQAILYLNRRGFAPTILCRECGQAVLCQACDIAMTYHQRQDLLRCHYCDRTSLLPDLCPHCHSPGLFPIGFGTEQVAQSFHKLFPHVSYDRLDADRVRGKGSQGEILGAFSRGDLKALIGTQMLVKGFDFPKVTVCGMVSADLHLNMADYRADERTFQAVMQLAGRAGRGDKEGKVFIQTYQPDHPILLACQAYDGEGFYRQALASRNIMQYPPFLSLARILITDEDKEVVRETTRQVHRFLHEESLALKVQVLGPSAAPIERIRGRYRAQFLLKAEEREAIERLGHKLVRESDSLRKNKKTRILIDIDPENIL